MEVIRNNFKALLIHICYVLLFSVGLFIYVFASPLYKVKIVGILILICLYLIIYTLYGATLIRYLKNSKNVKHDLLSGILVIIVGSIIWSIIYFARINSLDGFRDNELWIPYNIYISLLWPITYGIKTHQILLIFGLLNGIFAPIALLIKRMRVKG